jgi:copper transport protein
VIILALVTGWRFTPPPRSLAGAAHAPLAVHIHSDKLVLQMMVSPGTSGTNDFVLQLTVGDATPLQAQQVTLAISQPERGVEPFEHKAIQDGPGICSASLCRPLAGARRGVGDGL